MSMSRGLVGSVIGGVIGAAIWAAVAFFTHLEVGWIAWGVGVLAGIGMAAGGGRGVGAGFLAAVVALLSITGGKYLAVHLEVARLVEKGPRDFTEEDAKYAMADELTAEYIRQGRLEPDAAEYAHTDEVMEDVEAQWEAMSASERAAYTARIKEGIREEFEAFAGEMRAVGLLMSFGPFDLVWVVLALSSAYKLGSSRQEAGQHLEESLNLPPQSSPLDRYGPPPARVAAPAPPASEQFRIPGAPPLSSTQAAGPHPGVARAA